MKKIVFSVIIFINFINVNISQVVTTKAGCTYGYLDGTGTAAQFDNPFGVCIDAAGNVYAVESNNHKIRKISPAGVVTTFAGSTQGYADGTGTAAQFNSPSGICIDGSGNLYVGDESNHKIRKITPAGVVTTFVGSSQGYADGTGTAAQFSFPSGICIDGSDNLYVADRVNCKIRKISPAGVVTTLAGSSAGYIDATGASAQFNYPSGVCVDVSGNIYVADRSNCLIRKINSSGVVTTLAGNISPGYVDATGTSARFYLPYGVCTDASGNVYVGDQVNQKIRKITPAGVVTTFAGSTQGYTNGTGTAAQFFAPSGICIDASNNLYVGEVGNDIIRKISPVGIVTTLAGSPTGYLDGTASTAQFSQPNDVCVDAGGNIYTIDTGNNKIRKISNSGVVSTFAGSISGYSDGTGTSAQFNSLSGMCIDGIGNLYIVESNGNKIRKITSAGVVSTLAGSNTQGSADGTGISAQFCVPQGICIDGSGNLYVADLGNHRIRKITPAGVVTTIAGSSVGYLDANGTGAQFNQPSSVCFDNASGSVFVTDRNNHKIRKISSTGVVTTFVGSSQGASDGLGTAASFNYPMGICLSTSGNLYIADAGNSIIRKITSAGMVTTIAGSTIGFMDGTGTVAQFNNPNRICEDAIGNLYVADNGNNRIRKITPQAVPTASYSISSPKCTNSPISFTDQSTGSPTSWSWSFPGGIPSTSTAQNPTVSYTVAGTFSITLTATNGSGLSAPLTQTISINPLPNMTSASTATTCVGSAFNFSLTTDVASTYTYSYSSAQVLGGSSGSSSIITNTLVHGSLSAKPASYTITPTSSFGCIGNNQVLSVTVYPVPTLTVSASPGVICQGNSSSLTPTTDNTGGNGATSYTWNTSATSASIVVAPTSNTSYTVFAANAAGCVNQGTISITVNPSPTITVNSGSITSGQSFTMTAGGASSYTYSTGQTGFNAVVSPTITTTYTVTGTNSSGCTNTAVSTVTVNAACSAPTITITGGGGICAGQTKTLTVSGASTYTWNTGATAPSIVVSPSSTTVYTVTASNGGTCTTTGTVQVTVNVTPTITAIASPTAVCAGSSSNLTAAGATTYTWSTGAFTNTTVVTPTVNTTYSVTGKSVAGCISAVKIVTVVVNPVANITISATNSVTCLGLSNKLTASGASTYTWSTGANSYSISVTPTISSTYTVSGTQSGCISSKTITINPIDIAVTSTISNLTCNGVNNGTVTLNSTNGLAPYTYHWSNGSSAQTSTVVAAGNYTITSSDANGCQDSVSITVTQPTSLTVNTTITSPACGGSTGAITTTVSGGASPYTYIWNNGSSSSSATGLAPGQYQVQIYDATNCYGAAFINLNPTNGPTVSVGATNNVTCYGGNNGSTSISISGGIAPITVLWSNGVTTNSISSLQAGVYDVIITDASTCTVNQSIQITQPASITIQPVVFKPTCGNSDGSIALNIIGNPGPFTYTWSANAGGGNTATVGSIPAGQYNVIVGYNGSCTQSLSISVSNLTNIAVNVVSITPSFCGGASGAIDITVVNGVPAYTYSWSNGATTEDISPVLPGNYVVTVTDASNCQASANIFVPSNIFDYQPEICMVSVDTTNNTNYVVWQKNITYGVETYKIYRESSVPNSFQYVGSVSFGSLSEFYDPVADASVHSWRYRLSSVDSCGYEIPSNIDHKTIYLDWTNQGSYNKLVWNYYGGFNYNKFYISRYDVTNGWQLFDSVPGTTFTYNDITPPAFGTIKYLVEVETPLNCIPQAKMSGGSGNSTQAQKVKTKSNIKNDIIAPLPTNLTNANFGNNLFIAPNPAQTEIQVVFKDNMSVKTDVIITDVLGKVLILNSSESGNHIYTNVVELSTGIYFITIKQGKNSCTKKFVKE